MVCSVYELNQFDKREWLVYCAYREKWVQESWFALQSGRSSLQPLISLDSFTTQLYSFKGYGPLFLFYRSLCPLFSEPIPRVVPRAAWRPMLVPEDYHRNLFLREFKAHTVIYRKVPKLSSSETYGQVVRERGTFLKRAKNKNREYFFIVFCLLC